jgi:hypothetical protein
LREITVIGTFIVPVDVNLFLRLENQRNDLIKSRERVIGIFIFQNIPTKTAKVISQNTDWLWKNILVGFLKGMREYTTSTTT